MENLGKNFRKLLKISQIYNTKKGGGEKKKFPKNFPIFFVQKSL
jgi:hypothetical protein